MLMLISVTGCVDDLLLMQNKEEQSLETYSVSIALAGMGAEQTRAEGEDSEDKDGIIGTEDESFIDIDDLFVMTFSIEDGKTTLSNNSKLLEVLWNGKYENTSTKSKIFYNGSAAYLCASLNKKILEYSNKDFCIVALANMNQFAKANGSTLTLERNKTFGEIQQELEYKFTPNIQDNGDYYWLPYTEVNEKKAKQGIPLFGVKRVNLEKYDPEVYNFANPYTLISNGNPTLWMIRAFSKIEIELSDALLEKENELGEIRISSASINNKYASTFWVIPELDRMSGFSDTGGSGQINKVPGTGFRSNQTESNNSLQFKIDSERKKALIYLPEYFINDDNNRPEITLNLNIGEELHDFEFSLQQYNSNIAGQTQNTLYPWQYLTRNHSYKFMIGVDFRQIFSVVSDDWTKVYENEFTFGEKTTTE